MQDSELREVLASLTRTTRDLGWEDLFDRPVTPLDALESDIDPRLETRRLVDRLQRLVRDLGELESGIFGPGSEVHSVSFKTDLAVLDDAPAARGFTLDRDGGSDRRTTLIDLGRSLAKLSESLDADN